MNSFILERKIFILLLSALFVFAGSVDIYAQTDSASTSKKSVKKHKAHKKSSAVAYKRPAIASFLIDADSGKILESENADSLRYPASLTKMMTLYLTFEAIKKGSLTLNQAMTVSEHASGQPQTNISLQPGERILLKDAILSVVIRSANDSAVTIGETIGGTESGFAQKMTQKAKELGMKNTVFFNASGLPEPRQHTTARDMATLGLALRRDFPQYFPFFKTESFTYHGKTYETHNHVMMRYRGVDGIKTGYIRASGFNLVTSATKNGKHLIGVVMGGSSFKSRDDRMIAMLDRNFAKFASTKEKQGVAVNSTKKANPKQGDSEEEGEGDLPK